MGLYDRYKCECGYSGDTPCPTHAFKSPKKRKIEKAEKEMVFDTGDCSSSSSSGHNLPAEELHNMLTYAIENSPEGKSFLPLFIATVLENDK